MGKTLRMLFNSSRPLGAGMLWTGNSPEVGKVDTIMRKTMLRWSMPLPHPASSPIIAFSAFLKGVVKRSMGSGIVLNGHITQIQGSSCCSRNLLTVLIVWYAFMHALSLWVGAVLWLPPDLTGMQLASFLLSALSCLSVKGFWEPLPLHC